MRSKILVALAAVAGAVGTAAMMSTAAAPPAHADDLSDLIAAINSDYAAGSAAFSVALADFSSNEVAHGSAQLFASFDDDVLGPPYTLAVATAEILEGDPVSGGVTFGIAPPADFADGLAIAQNTFTESGSLFAEGVSALGSGDYVSAASDFVFSGDFASVYPLEEVLLGAIASL